MTFRARYGGECAFCGETIAEGELMDVMSGASVNGYEVEGAPACADCAATETDPLRWQHERREEVATTRILARLDELERRMAEVERRLAPPLRLAGTAI